MSIYTIYTTIIKNTGIFFEIVLLDTPFLYVGVSVGTVTHKQGLGRIDLQEKTFTGSIGQKLGIEIIKMPS
jgi:hypothetical protein